MSPFTCARESELTALLDRGQWPLAASADLSAHVAGCRTCAELAQVRQALQAARAASLALPALPSAGALWWRAQLRRRNADLVRINRPILGAQIFATVLTLLLATAALAWELRRGLHPAAWLQALHLEALWPASFGSLGFLMPLLAMLVLVSGVVVYFASEKQ